MLMFNTWTPKQSVKGIPVVICLCIYVFPSFEFLQFTSPLILQFIWEPCYRLMITTTPALSWNPSSNPARQIFVRGQLPWNLLSPICSFVNDLLSFFPWRYLPVFSLIIWRQIYSVSRLWISKPCLLHNPFRADINIDGDYGLEKINFPGKMRMRDFFCFRFSNFPRSKVEICKWSKSSLLSRGQTKSLIP